MAHARLTGSFVALITPFNQDGSIDWEGFRTLLRFQADNGTAAVLIMGSTGEVSMLSPEERRDIIARTVKMKPAGLTLYFGCTGNNTQTTIDYLKFAEAEGADGAILAAPPYIAASEADIEAHFFKVADSVDMALGIYNNPPRVQTDLRHDALLRLFEHPNYVVLKESTSRVGQVGQVLAGAPDAAVMCCDSPNLGLVVPTMALGGHGTANMTGNIAPRELAAISEPWTADGAGARFRQAYLRNLPILHYTYSAINPVALKSLMAAVGLPAGPLREPLKALTGGRLQEGIDIVKALGLDQAYGYATPDAMRTVA